MSDFHHIKRLRYRLLSCILHTGFDLQSGVIFLDDVKEVLSDIVWCNENFTKMHDKFQLELFKPENLINLIETKNFPAAAYWFSISVSILAMEQKD